MEKLDIMSELKKNKPSFKKILKRSIPGYIFVMPLVIGILVFSIIPVFQSLYYSFHDYNGFASFKFVGFKNFTDLFKYDIDGFGKILKNTFIYASLSVVIGLVLSYLLAVSVNKPFKGIYAVRVLFYLPCVIPGVVMSAMWTDLLSAEGAINSILTGIGLKPFAFFQAANTSMVSLLLTGLWGLGGGMILWLAAFKNIPRALYESAEIDGAKKIDCFLHITIPMSTPTIFYNLIVGIIGSLQFNGTLMLAPYDGKGLENSVYFVAVKIYRDAFIRMRFGYASAAAWVLFAIIGVLVAIMFKTSKWVFYGDE